MDFDLAYNLLCVVDSQIKIYQYDDKLQSVYEIFKIDDPAQHMLINKSLEIYYFSYTANVHKSDMHQIYATKSSFQLLTNQIKLFYG